MLCYTHMYIYDNHYFENILRLQWTYMYTINILILIKIVNIYEPNNNNIMNFIIVIIQ